MLLSVCEPMDTCKFVRILSVDGGKRGKISDFKER